MRNLSVLLLGGVLLAGCRTPEYALPPPPYTAEDMELHFTVLPDVKFDDTPLWEATQAVRAAWQKQAPGKKIPQIVLFEIKPESTVTMECRNIPVWVCLQYMARATGLTLRVQGDRIMFRPCSTLGNDEETEFVPVSKKGQEFLGLSADTSREDLKAKLEAHGIKFQAGCNFPVIWFADSESILIHNYCEEVYKLYGILSLVDEGYEIRKGTAQ